MNDQDFDLLEVALRVYARRADERAETTSPPRGRKLRRREPQCTIVFDTETSTDPSQRFLYGVWRYYVDRRNSTPGRFCVQEGIVYADDLRERDPQGFAILQRYVETHQADVAPGKDTTLAFYSRSEFVEKVLWRHGHEHRATIAGFNLPFDLSRLALAVSAARGRKGRTTYAGGFSLKLWHNERFRPRIDYKTVDSKRTLIGFTTAYGATHPFRGHFLDLRTLAFALTDRGHSLESACRSFGVPYTKRRVELGTVSENAVAYCREDVAATSQLLGAVVADYRRHPIDLQETRAFSPATIGKSYLDAMGITPILERQEDFDPAVLGRAMAGFFGGRAECRIRKVPLPVVYVDFLSMYPTVNALMGSWRLVTTRRIAVDETTDKVRRLLRAPDLFQRCFTRSLWQKLPCLVEVEPDGDVLPVRAAYDSATDDFGIGVNPYRHKGTAWYPLADVVVSVLLTGKVPTIRRALSLRPVGRQGGLRPVKIRGHVEVDPVGDDFFCRAIELRHEIATDLTYPPQERERLSGFLKVLVNATSYGILAEFVRHEETNPVDVVVHCGGDEPFATTTTTPEDPGRFCFPPLAACITGAARLMLALLERCVTDAGGNYVFCDTDSMGIVSTARGGLYGCPGGDQVHTDGTEAVKALSWEQVDAIVGRFSTLSPYDRRAVPGSILKIEKENHEDNDPDRRRRQLWCWAISAKRYVLYSEDEAGPELNRVTDGNEEAGTDVSLAKASRHGLGHLLNPLDPDDPSESWIDEVWRYLLLRALGQMPARPS